MGQYEFGNLNFNWDAEAGDYGSLRLSTARGASEHRMQENRFPGIHGVRVRHLGRDRLPVVWVLSVGFAGIDEAAAEAVQAGFEEALEAVRDGVNRTLVHLGVSHPRTLLVRWMQYNRRLACLGNGGPWRFRQHYLIEFSVTDPPG